ncbi:MAG: transporter substrate-binding domain-containing protein [Pseudomonadota bacterium]
MTISRRLIGAALAMAVTVAGFALPASAQSAAQSLSSESIIESIKREGVVKIGMSLFRPWSMRDLNGELVGFELDVGRQLAEDMGVEVEFVPTAWDGIIPALVAGKFDVIISGMSITPQRALTVSFSDPYAYSGSTILANIEMTEGFTLEDYNSPDVIFAARRGATPATVIANMFPQAELLLFDEDGASTQEVLNGNAHATMASEPTPSSEARRYPDTLYVPFEQAFQVAGEAFAFRKGDPDAENYFNSWIGVKTRTGWLQERHDYWFRGDEWESEVPAK